MNPKNISIYPHIYHPEIKILVIRTEIISYFLNSFFKIDFGYKKDTPIPEFIIQNNDFSASAVRGIFDAEGSVVYKKRGNTTLRKVIIGMKDELYLKGIQKILNRFGVYSNLFKDQKGIFRLIVGERRSVIRFYRKIKPLQSEKSKKLRRLVENYKQTNWISSKDLIPKILRLLLDGPKKRSEICHNLNISYSQAGLRFKNLKKNNLIKADRIERHWCIYSITSKGRRYLKTSVVADLS